MKKIVSAVLILVLLLGAGSAARAENLGMTGITVTRGPVSEVHHVGDTACFSAAADTYETVNWTILTPGGLPVSVQRLQILFPELSVEGENTPELRIGNLSAEMDGWAVFCSFHNSFDNADTQWAFLTVLP